MKLAFQHITTYVFWVLTFFIAFDLHAQILDDSTKMKYNPTSVIQQSGEDIYYNRLRFTHPKTSLTGLHSYQSLFANGMYSQDLGNYHTPRGYVVPVVPSTIGARYGFTAFDDFVILPDSVLYMDTRSPYTSLDYVQGSRGQQRMNVVHSRNINPRWNMTALVRRMGSRKLLGSINTNDRQASNWSFGLTNRYYSKDARYQLLAQVISTSILHYDHGGIVPDSSDAEQGDLYRYNLSKVGLHGVTTSDKRVTARVYQQYAIRKDSALQIFNQIDFASRNNRYKDPNLRNNLLFYPGIINDTNSTSDRVAYTQGDFKIGVKGSKSFLFYSLYYNTRYYKYELPYSSVGLGTDGINTMLGGEVIGNFYKSWHAGFATEWSLTTSEHVLEGKLLHKLLEVRYKQMQYTPTLQQQMYEGNHFSWNNNFNFIKLQHLNAKLRLQSKSLSFVPEVKWMRYNNYVYINEFALPAQYSNDLDVWSSNVNLAINKRLWILENTFQYNFSSNENILRVPETINQTRLLLQGYLFKKATFMQIGVDVFFRSAWIGNRYMPVTQLYYLGNSTNNFNRLDAYTLFDVFLTMQVKTARFFFKMAYLNQGMGSNGYMVSPYYSGMPRTFEFGINWQFFD